MTYHNTPSAQALTRTLGGRWHGRYGVAPCPACQPERRRDQRGLSLSDGSDGRLLLRCHKSRCAFPDLLTALGLAPGAVSAPDPEMARRREAEARVDAEKRAAQAERCWHEAQPIAGTLAERYLRGRAITAALPETLRFHPECWHGPTARRLPAIVARVDGAERFAVHRTYLSPEGGKAAVEPNKMALGGTAGGAVRLRAGTGGLAVGEGLETVLSLASGLWCSSGAIWACLGTSGLSGVTLLPFDPSCGSGDLLIALDGDDAGRAAAHTLASRASAEGWRVRMLPAPEGCDWNDVLRREAGR